MTNFQLAVAFTAKAEGGFTVDNGGPTDFGVTQETYDTYRDSIGAPRQSVTLITQAEVQAIMWAMFWLPSHCDDLPTRLSVCQFDAAFNSGADEAIKLLQRTLGVSVDGDYGPFTHAAVLACHDDIAALRYLDVRWAFMQEICAGEPPTERLNGYRNRITNLRGYLATIGGSQ